MLKKGARGSGGYDKLLGGIAMIFLAFFLLKIIPSLFFWVDDTGAWFFFVVFIILLIRPMIHKYKK